MFLGVRETRKLSNFAPCHGEGGRQDEGGGKSYKGVYLSRTWGGGKI